MRVHIWTVYRALVTPALFSFPSPVNPFPIRPAYAFFLNQRATWRTTPTSEADALLNGKWCWLRKNQSSSTSIKFPSVRTRFDFETIQSYNSILHFAVVKYIPDLLAPPFWWSRDLQHNWILTQAHQDKDIYINVSIKTCRVWKRATSKWIRLKYFHKHEFRFSRSHTESRKK